MIKTLVQGYIADKWYKQDWSLWKIGLVFKNTNVLTSGGVCLPIPLLGAWLCDLL